MCYPSREVFNCVESLVNAESMDSSRSHKYKRKPVNFPDLGCTEHEESAIVFKPQMKTANSMKKLCK